jgi:arginine decarboxylase
LIKEVEVGMKIQVINSTGVAPTELAAFDAALRNAGIANTNIVCLSSVIPPKSEIVREKPNIIAKDFGKRLYAVMARKSSETKGERVAAGIGWIMEKNQQFGLFVEHVGGGRDEVDALIRASLKDMMKNRPEYDFSRIERCIEETICGDQPVCVLVTAVYQVDDWD